MLGYPYQQLLPTFDYSSNLLKSGWLLDWCCSWLLKTAFWGHLYFLEAFPQVFNGIHIGRLRWPVNSVYLIFLITIFNDSCSTFRIIILLEMYFVLVTIFLLSFLCKIPRYTSFVMIPSINSKLPISDQDIEPKVITPPPLCFTVGFKFFNFRASPFSISVLIFGALNEVSIFIFLYYLSFFTIVENLFATLSWKMLQFSCSIKWRIVFNSVNYFQTLVNACGSYD